MSFLGEFMLCRDVSARGAAHRRREEVCIQRRLKKELNVYLCVT